MTQQNHFLATLSDADLALLRPHIEAVDLVRDDPIAHADRPVGYAYFPLKCILSVLVVMRDGRLIESRTIGRESGFGLLNALGSRMSFEEVIVQVGGEACRISIPALAAAAAQSPNLLRSLAHHAQATILQAAQFTACNALHEVEPRLCRWLLMTQDRLGTPLLPLTQEHLSIMLGVQRTTVTAVAQHLQDKGLVSYSRGRIRVLDRAGLEANACECYDAISSGTGMMLGEEVA